MSARRAYPTDLTDEEWAVRGPLVPAPKPGGRPAVHSRREICNALRYGRRSGGAWRMLPHDVPPWPSVYGYLRTWRRDGPWQRIHDLLRSAVRGQAGRAPQPSAASADSQTVKTADHAGRRGYDAGKTISGRKRHLLVDTLGLLLVVLVTTACGQDRDGAKHLCPRAKRAYPRLHRIWADGRYRGALVRWVAVVCGWTLTIVRQTGTGCHVLPKRWIVERPVGWLVQWRRLRTDYEDLPATTEALIYVALMSLMVRRLARRRRPSHQAALAVPLPPPPPPLARAA